MNSYDSSKHCPVIFYGAVWRHHQPEIQWTEVVAPLVGKLVGITGGLTLSLDELLAMKPESVTRKHVDDLYMRQEQGDVVAAAILALGWHSVAMLSHEAFKTRLGAAELYSKVMDEDEQMLVGSGPPWKRT